MRLPRHAVAWAAAFALLCAQALGLAHAVAHAHAHESALARVLQAECEDHTHGGPVHEHSLFDAHHDEGSPHCLLFDQLAHADGLTDAGASAQFAPPDASFSDAPTQPRREHCACGYHARGPPLLLA
jgi:hypothetical protein